MPNIDVIDGRAEFINNHSLRVHRPEGNLEIHGEKIFINTGAQTVVPPIPELPPRREYMTAPDYLI